MNIAKGPDEVLLSVNAGLLFSTKSPETFLERAWIELVVRDDEAGKNYTEKYFKVAIHNQLRDALNYIQANIIHEKIKKIPGQATADRFYNFPFEAIEEALSNAVYHKSYELNKPIEIQIWLGKIEILSFPGPVPPVYAKVLASQRRIVSRDYRNKRIGIF